MLRICEGALDAIAFVRQGGAFKLGYCMCRLEGICDKLHGKRLVSVPRGLRRPRLCGSEQVWNVEVRP